MNESVFFDSEKLMDAILIDPDILLESSYIIPVLEDEMINRGYVPEKKYFYAQPKLRSFTKLIDYAIFQKEPKDPSMLIFYPEDYLDINNHEILRKIMEAVTIGYVATEEDLIYNPKLCYFNSIMRIAIKNKSELLRYVRGNCFFMPNDLKEFTEKYKITKEDLINNPELTKNVAIMAYFPEFKLYCNPLSIDLKIDALAKVLESKEKLNTDTLPFLDKKFDGKTDISKLQELLDILSIDFDENNVFTQKKFYTILDQVVDGVVNVNYIIKKRMFEFEFPNIVALNDMILKEFNSIKDGDKEATIDKITTKIQKFVGCTVLYENIEKEIRRFYDMYKKNSVIGLSTTSDFCNRILNLHKDWFIKTNKRVVFRSVRSKLYLTDRKKKSLITGYKVQKIADAIKDDELEILGIDIQTYKETLDKAKTSILGNKEVRRSPFGITEEFIDLVINVFEKEGKIKDDTTISEIRTSIYAYKISGNYKGSSYEPANVFISLLMNYILRYNISNNDFDKILDDYCEIARYIIKKVNNVRNVFIKSFELTKREEKELERKNKPDGVNYNDYVIASRKRYYKNLATILLSLDDEKLSSILQNKDDLNDVVDLVPFVGLVDGFDKDKFVDIMQKYQQAKDKILKFGSPKEDESDIEYIFRRLELLMLFSTAYNSVSDITISALGNDLMSILDASKANGYIEIYKKMLNRKVGAIPPIQLVYDNIYLESGKYGDPDRFLISKKPIPRSCVDLEDSGEEIYKEMLTSYSGDVALIRNNRGEVISRVFLIRRGNIVQMATSCSEHFPIEMFKQMGDQIINRAIESGDNIDFVFINSSSCEGQNCSNYISVHKTEFITAFPHADLYHTAYLLSSKDKTHDYTKGGITIDFNAEPKALYQGIRRSVKNNPIESEITRLIALNIEMTENGIKKEDMARNFKQLHYGEYDKVMCGEDWYVAVKKNGIVEELILQSADERSKEELDEARMSLQAGYSYK